MPNKRRFRLLIDAFQTKLLIRFVLYWLIYQVTLWNFLFCWQLLKEGKGNPLEQFARFCGEHYPMLICLAIVVPFFAWDAMRFTHRVAGPIYRLRQTIRAITADEPLRRVKLRDGDQLLEVIDDLNIMLEALEQRGAVKLCDRSTRNDQHDSEPAIQECGTHEGSSHEQSYC